MFVSSSGFNHGYVDCCSTKCSHSYKIVKTRKTCLEKYGVDNYLKTDEFKERKIKTWIQKYGVDHTSKCPEVRRKMEETTLKRYGVKSVLSLPEVHENIKFTEESIRKRKETCLKKYGVDFVSKNEEIKEKIRETSRKKYGYDSPKQSPIVKEKWLKTTRERTFDSFLNKISSRQLELLSSKDEYINSDVIKLRCLVCGREFFVDRSKKEKFYCGCRKSISHKEIDLFNWLKLIDIEGEIFQSNRSIIWPYELDIYLPSYKLAIEFDGLYWHSEKDKFYHLNKTLKCEEQGIQLIHVFENEWLEKQEIVKSIILSKLKKSKRIIDSSDCKILQITDEQYKNFIEKNSLEKNILANNKIGLFFKNELVKVLSFNVLESEIEIIHKCTSLNTCVINGFEKIINYIINLYKNRKITIFVDRRYESFFNYNDWSVKDKISPRCWFWKCNTKPFKLYSSEEFQEHKDKRLLNTLFADISFDHKSIRSLGYLHIWDCGQLKLEYRGI